MIRNRILAALLLSTLFACSDKGTSTDPIASSGAVDRDYLTSYKVYDSAGNLQSEYSFTYDSSLFLTQMTGYNPDGSIKNKTKYTKNSNGLRLSSSTYTANDSMTAYSLFTYDSLGNMIRSTHYAITNGVATSSRTSYSQNYYQNSNKVKSEFCDAYEICTDSLKYSYDQSGKRIRSDYPNGRHAKWNYVSETQLEITNFDTNAKLINKRVMYTKKGKTPEKFLDHFYF